MSLWLLLSHMIAVQLLMKLLINFRTSKASLLMQQMESDKIGKPRYNG